MAMIKCPECQKEISDKADKCLNCGFPIKDNLNGKNETTANDNLVNETVINNTETVKKEKLKNSSLSIVAFILSFLGGLAVIGFILSIVDLSGQKKEKIKHKHGFSIAALIISLFMIAAVFGSNKDKEDNTTNDNKTTVESTTETSNDASKEEKTTDNNVNNTNVEETIVQKEETTVQNEETQTVSISKEDFINSCTEVNFKDISRNPENYIGQNFDVIVYVLSAREGGFFTGYQKYYTCYYYDQSKVDEMVKKGWLSDENDDSAHLYGIDYDKSIWLLDNRDENSSDYLKILDGDVIHVYGTFNGMQETSNSLTKEKGEELALDIKFVELISE